MAQNRERVSRQANKRKNVGRKRQDLKSPLSRLEGMDLGSQLLFTLSWGKRSKTLDFQDQFCQAKQQRGAAHLRVSQFRVIHFGHKVTGGVLQILLWMIIIIPGTGKGELIVHISLPLPSPCYPHHQPMAITVPMGGKRVTVLHSLGEDYKFQIYIKDGQGGSSALATSFYLSLSQTHLCREKEQADSKLKRQQGAQGKVAHISLGQLGFLGIQVETLGYKMRGL